MCMQAERAGFRWIRFTFHEIQKYKIYLPNVLRQTYRTDVVARAKIRFRTWKNCRNRASQEESS